MEKIPKYISVTPKRNIKNLIDKEEGKRALKIDDIEYTQNRSYRSKGMDEVQWMLIGGFILCFIAFRPYRGAIGFFTFLFAGGAFLFAFIYSYIAPLKYFVANRQTGKLRVPISIKKPAIYVSFDDGFTYEKTAYMEIVHTSLFFQTKPDIKPGAVFSLADLEREDYWSFLVWYMDKNRPLPPGTAFDAYRQKDFERRKAEGFPKPLYKSAVPTPEATPEQQAERLIIGGW